MHAGLFGWERCALLINVALVGLPLGCGESCHCTIVPDVKHLSILLSFAFHDFVIYQAFVCWTRYRIM